MAKLRNIVKGNQNEQSEHLMSTDFIPSHFRREKKDPIQTIELCRGIDTYFKPKESTDKYHFDTFSREKKLG